MHNVRKACDIMAAALLGFALLALSQPALAQTTIFSELAENVKAPAAVAKLGPDLFGDQVNLYTGVLAFEKTDLVWAGTGDIPIRLSRRLAVGKDSLQIGGRAFG